MAHFLKKVVQAQTKKSNFNPKRRFQMKITKPQQENAL